MAKKILIVIALLVVVVLGGWIYLSFNQERACSLSGGTVTSFSCCRATGDFPNSCLVGACACSPKNSHEVKTCDCGADKCFDGLFCRQAK